MFLAVFSIFYNKFLSEKYLEKIWENYIEENINIKNIKFIEVVDVLEDFSKWLYN